METRRSSTAISAIAIQLDPATLGTISEAYAALGDTAQAAQYARAMTVERAQSARPDPSRVGTVRARPRTAADARRVLAKARAERRERRDVYGYDLLAWALHRHGRHAEARRLIAGALARGYGGRAAPSITPA